MVKRCRSKSSEKPSAFICSRMRPPYFSFHCHTRSRNFSRPTSWRDFCSRRIRSRSTSIWVAMPAWSMPGIHMALAPCMRRQRMRMSWMVPPRAWPMCSEPVTLGGGRVMAYGAIAAAASAWK